MKITKRQLRRIIREEKKRLLSEGRPWGSAELFAGSGITIFNDGTFNVDVLINHEKEAITGKLDEDSLLYLIELGVIKEVR